MQPGVPVHRAALANLMAVWWKPRRITDSGRCNTAALPASGHTASERCFRYGHPAQSPPSGGHWFPPLPPTGRGQAVSSARSALGFRSQFIAAAPILPQPSRGADVVAVSTRTGHRGAPQIRLGPIIKPLSSYVNNAYAPVFLIRVGNTDTRGSRTDIAVRQNGQNDWHNGHLQSGRMDRIWRCLAAPGVEGTGSAAA